MRPVFGKTFFLDSILEPPFIQKLCPIFDELTFLVGFIFLSLGESHNRTDIDMYCAKYQPTALHFENCANARGVKSIISSEFVFSPSYGLPGVFKIHIWT